MYLSMVHQKWALGREISTIKVVMDKEGKPTKIFKDYQMSGLSGLSGLGSCYQIQIYLIMGARLSAESRAELRPRSSSGMNPFSTR